MLRTKLMIERKDQPESFSWNSSIFLRNGPLTSFSNQSWRSVVRKMREFFVLNVILWISSSPLIVVLKYSPLRDTLTFTELCSRMDCSIFSDTMDRALSRNASTSRCLILVTMPDLMRRLNTVWRSSHLTLSTESVTPDPICGGGGSRRFCNWFRMDKQEAMVACKTSFSFTSNCGSKFRIAVSLFCAFRWRWQSSQMICRRNFSFYKTLGEPDCQLPLPTNARFPNLVANSTESLQKISPHIHCQSQI